jgi:hypothetical protein
MWLSGALDCVAMIVDPREIEIKRSRPRRPHRLARHAVRYRCRWRAPNGRELSCYLWQYKSLLGHARTDPMEFVRLAAAERIQALVDEQNEM